MARIITRDNQQTDVLYVLPDGTCFVTPDETGRYWYDSKEEASADIDFDRVIHIDGTDD